MGNRPPQQTVRVGQLEKTLARFNQEIGLKTGQTLATYDRQWVDPMRQRIELIELLLGIRACRWVKNRLVAEWRWARDKVRGLWRRRVVAPAEEPVEEPAVEEPTPA